MIHSARLPVLGAVILSGLLGCDNVTWGGADLSLEAPPPPPGSEGEPEAEEQVDTLPPLPEGRVLFVVRRSDAGARLLPVAEMSGDSLLPFPTEAELPGFTARYVTERLVPDREYTLLLDGARVGRFIAGATVATDSFYCQSRPAVEGVIEIVPEVADQDLFLAVPAEGFGPMDRTLLSPVPSDRGLRVASLRVAGILLNEARARWPEDLVSTRADLQLLPLSPSDPATMLGTFVFMDRLRVETPASTAYSLFFVAENAGAGYEHSFWTYRPVEPQGKGIPVYAAHADWDGDGQQEILLDVLGSESRWLAALDRQPEGWRLAFQDPCGVPADSSGT